VRLRRTRLRRRLRSGLGGRIGRAHLREDRGRRQKGEAQFGDTTLKQGAFPGPYCQTRTRCLGLRFTPDAGQADVKCLPVAIPERVRHTRRCFLDDFTGTIMRSLLFWLIGIPIPIIILVWLVTGHA